MAATDFVTETQLDSLTTTIATEVKSGNTAHTAHLNDATAAHAASAISIVDSGALYTATDVEAALAEVKTVADSAAGGGAVLNDAIQDYVVGWTGQKIKDVITADISTERTSISSEIDADVAAGLATLVNGAPGALDDLNELAAAMGDDANFAATMTTALGFRLRFDAAQTLTAPNKAQALTNLGIVASSVDFAAAFTAGLA